jgi:hypothetical protein
MAVSGAELARAREEFIAALDRRLPQVQQADEAVIAREAAALRANASARLADLANDCAEPACSSPARDPSA